MVMWMVQQEKAEDWIIRSMIGEGLIGEGERGNISEKRMFE